MAQQDYATETIDGKNASRLREAYQTISGSLGAGGRSRVHAFTGKRLLLRRNPVRLRFQEASMKRIRRISLSIEHREVSVSISQTMVTSGESRTPRQPGDAAEPENCPDCGAPWITVAAHAGEDASTDATSIYRALQQCGVHTHVSATGVLRICSKSLDEIKESL